MASSSSSSSSPPTILRYTLTTSLFIILFLASVFLFTRRTLEPFLSPYFRADISLTADPIASTFPPPKSDSLPFEAPAGVPFEIQSDVGGVSRGDGAKIESNDEGKSHAAVVAVENDLNDGGGSRDDGFVQIEPNAGGNSRSGGVTVETERNDGGNSSGEVPIEENEERHGESVDREVVEKMRRCDFYKGSWVRDEDYPLYEPGSCPYVDEAFDCQRNGRPDSDYLKWRWKPDACDLPRFNATNFLVRLRGKRLMLVGDSMNRNQFESMLCLLREGLSNKSRMYEIHGHKITKGRGYYVFKFEDYNCTVEFVRSHFLVKEGVRINGQGNSNPTLSIDRIDKTHTRWKQADILVFNTGHWWVHGKTARGKNYYKEGDYIYPQFDATKAYRRALRTWANWVRDNLKPNKQLVFYRGYSSAHFRGGEWDSGGSCNGETEPVLKGSILDSYPLKMKIVEEVINETQVPVILLNVTKLTNFRKDAHPSVYGKINTDGKKGSTRRQDCSHWCLPGVPDVWNQLIYATLFLQTGHQ